MRLCNRAVWSCTFALEVSIKHQKTIVASTRRACEADGVTNELQIRDLTESGIRLI